MPAFNSEQRYEGGLPTGEFENRGFIGRATTNKLWDLGWNANEGFEDTDGKIVPVGKVYRGGAKPEAEAYLKANQFNNNKFITAVLVTTMPIDSICNLTKEQAENFKYPIQLGAPWAGLGKDHTQVKNVGLGLVVIPSIVDAYAKFSGWYKDGLFPLSSFTSGLEHVADASGLIEELVVARTTIWKALGEDDWKTGDGTDSKRLQEALNGAVLSRWTMFCRLHTVFDPSHGAIYTSKKDNAQTRQRIQVISEFYPSEREAVAAGQAELAARAEKSASNGATAPKDVYVSLSAKAKKSYDEETWIATVPDIKLALEAQQPMARVAKEYGVTVEDLGLLA